MALLDVRSIGDPVLDQKAAPVESVGDEERRLLDDMVETMRDQNGIGLAAPQVGISRRLVVVELDGDVHRMINPVVAETRGRSKGIEACLSVPDIEGEVERADWIRVEYTDEEGQSQGFEAQGLLARCIQHECDHLDGVLFVARLSSARRLMLRKRLKELRRETRRRLQVAAAG